MPHLYSVHMVHSINLRFICENIFQKILKLPFCKYLVTKFSWYYGISSSFIVTIVMSSTTMAVSTTSAGPTTAGPTTTSTTSK